MYIMTQEGWRVLRQYVDTPEGRQLTPSNAEVWAARHARVDAARQRVEEAQEFPRYDDVQRGARNFALNRRYAELSVAQDGLVGG